MASTRSSLASQPPSPFAKPASYAAAPFPSPSAAQPHLTDFLPKFRFRTDHASCVTHSKAAFPPATASPVHELSESPADRKSTCMNSSHSCVCRMPSSACNKITNLNYFTSSHSLTTFSHISTAYV